MPTETLLVKITPQREQLQTGLEVEVSPDTPCLSMKPSRFKKKSMQPIGSQEMICGSVSRSKAVQHIGKLLPDPAFQRPLILLPGRLHHGGN